MEFRGHVEDGKIVLDEPAALADGTEVSVKPVRRRPATAKRTPLRKRQGVYDRVRKLAGEARDLSADASRPRGVASARVPSGRRRPRINAATTERGDRSGRKANSRRKPLTISKRLLGYAGCATDLPADASVNVDHYLYGHPKR